MLAWACAAYCPDATATSVPGPELAAPSPAVAAAAAGACESVPQDAQPRQWASQARLHAAAAVAAAAATATAAAMLISPDGAPAPEVAPRAEG